MIEFVEECRREWKRLGVPDPIANEMALDLTADIEEAEADGGSAEDVLGNSLFDPRRFAAAWASARGVTAPPTPVEPLTPLDRKRQAWSRPAMVGAWSLLDCSRPSSPSLQPPCSSVVTALRSLPRSAAASRFRGRPCT